MNLSSPSIAMALVAPLALCLWIRTFAEPRPSPALTLIVFALGAASIIPAGYVASILAVTAPARLRDPYVVGLRESLLEAALPEEAVRLVVVAIALGLAWRRAMPMTALVFGAVAGSGFAASEGALGVLGGEGVLMIAVGRSLSAVGHACYGIIMGFYLGRVLTGGRRRVIDGVLALGLPVLLHTLYDFPILTKVPGAEDALAGDQLPPWPEIAFMVMTPVMFVLEVTLAVVAVRRTRGAPLGVPDAPPSCSPTSNE
jgi:RsiW-degrading membrane proteinase PrsW (M82 family)